MALTNKGFNGTVDEADYARMMSIGLPEGVDSAGAWAVTQGAGRQVAVAAQNGWAFARGVISKDTAVIAAALGTPLNGQWYLIVRRINWATKLVSVVAISHTSTSTTIPTDPPTGYPTASSTPGVEYDQFLAWAWVRSTDTTMVLFDLRHLSFKLDGSTRSPWTSDWITTSPPVAPASGALSTAVGSSLVYRWSRGAIEYDLTVTIQAAGTGAGNINVTVPWVNALATMGSGFVTETGLTVWGYLAVGGSLLAIALSTNATAIASGRTIRVSGRARV